MNLQFILRRFKEVFCIYRRLVFSRFFSLFLHSLLALYPSINTGSRSKTTNRNYLHTPENRVRIIIECGTSISIDTAQFLCQLHVVLMRVVRHCPGRQSRAIQKDGTTKQTTTRLREWGGHQQRDEGCARAPTEEGHGFGVASKGRQNDVEHGEGWHDVWYATVSRARIRLAATKKSCRLLLMNVNGRRHCKYRKPPVDSWVWRQWFVHAQRALCRWMGYPSPSHIHLRAQARALADSCRVERILQKKGITEKSSSHSPSLSGTYKFI